jgi:hypothetical protein
LRWSSLLPQSPSAWRCAGWLPCTCQRDDPRRRLVAQVLLYAGTFIVIAASVWLQRR